jgi:hypothetical protein
VIELLPWRSVTTQLLRWSSQSMNAPTASGNDCSILIDEILRVPYGRGTGSATTDG